MRCACVDIGSNTTRLLVADHAGGVLTPVLEQRTFTRMGRACGPGGTVPDGSVAALSAVVSAQVSTARAEGAEALRVVATAALRRAANGRTVCARVGAAAGVDVELLSEREEARLAFAGATRDSASGNVPGAVTRIGVADVGGGSSELIVGTCAAGVTWSRSLPLGSGDLADAHLHSDPPTAAELDAIRTRVAAAIDAIDVPDVDRALAVGGSATSLRRLAGPRLDPEALARSISTLAAAPAAVVAERHELDPVRVRLLPAGILVLAGIAARLGPLTVADGGLREGVVLELARR